MRKSSQRSLGFDALERIQLLSTAQPMPGTAAHVAAAQPSADLNGDGRVDLADQVIFVAAFGSRRGYQHFNPAADLTGDGFVGRDDARILLSQLTNPPVQRRPLRLDLQLARGQQVPAPHTKNSGGVTRQSDVTIVGRTTPNSLILTDPPAANYSFTGPAFVADDQGYFAQTIHTQEALTNHEFLVISPSGQRVIRSFPVLNVSLIYRRN